MTEKDKNERIVKDNKIKAFEEKAGNFSADNPMLFNVYLEKDIEGVTMGVLDNGIPYLTEQGLAQLCGIHRRGMYRISQEWYNNIDNRRNNKIKELLPNFKDDNLFIKVKLNNSVNNVYIEDVCMAILEYYAFHSTKKNEKAQFAYRTLARTSFRLYIYEKLGYINQTKKIEEWEAWKYFLDRVDLNYDNVPSEYFSTFKEIAGLTVSLIRNKVIIDDRTIPDISVGLSWGKYWSNNNLDEIYGKRIKYTHNYPAYYPQSTSNPQEPWAYPNKSLPFFRKWFEFEYIVSKFPQYLLKM